MREQWHQIKLEQQNGETIGEVAGSIAKRWRNLSEPEKDTYAQKLYDEQQLLQNVENSYADLSPTKYLQSLLDSCGKLQLLDRMLPKLKEKGHKVCGECPLFYHIVD